MGSGEGVVWNRPSLHPLNDESWERLAELVDVLELHRSADTPNKRHQLYRAAPEAWLESLLRRNIGAA